MVTAGVKGMRKQKKSRMGIISSTTTPGDGRDHVVMVTAGVKG